MARPTSCTIIHLAQSQPLHICTRHNLTERLSLFPLSFLEELSQGLRLLPETLATALQLLGMADLLREGPLHLGIEARLNGEEVMDREGELLEQKMTVMYHARHIHDHLRRPGDVGGHLHTRDRHPEPHHGDVAHLSEAHPDEDDGVQATVHGVATEAEAGPEVGLEAGLATVVGGKLQSMGIGDVLIPRDTLF